MEKNWEEEQSQHGKEMARRGIGWGTGPAGAVRGVEWLARSLEQQPGRKDLEWGQGSPYVLGFALESRQPH